MNIPAARQPVNATSAGLMIRQLEEWEDSIFLSDDELIAALTADRSGYRNMDGSVLDWGKSVRFYREHYPDGVAYSVVDGSGRTCYGLRYGFRGEQYISF